MSVEAVVISRFRSKKDPIEPSSLRQHLKRTVAATTTAVTTSAATMFAEFAERKKFSASTKCTVCVQCHRQLIESITLRNCNHQFCLSCFNNFCRLQYPKSPLPLPPSSSSSSRKFWRYVCHECTQKNHSMTKPATTTNGMVSRKNGFLTSETASVQQSQQVQYSAPETKGTSSMLISNKTSVIATNTKTVTKSQLANNGQVQPSKQPRLKNGQFARKKTLNRLPVPKPVSVKKPYPIAAHSQQQSFPNHILMNISQNFFEPIQKFACNRNGLLPIRKIKPIYAFDVIYEYPLLNVVNANFRNSSKSAFVNMQIENVPRLKQHRPSGDLSPLAKLTGCGSSSSRRHHRHRSNTIGEPKRSFLPPASSPPADFQCFSQSMQKLLPTTAAAARAATACVLEPPAKRVRTDETIRRCPKDIFEMKEHHYFLRPKKMVEFSARL